MKTRLKLVMILFITLAGSSYGQSIVGLTGGYSKSEFFDNAVSSPYYGTYKSPASYCITAFLKQRTQNHINFCSELSFVNKVLNLKASYGGLGSGTHRDVNYHLNYVYVSIFPELSIGKRYTFNFSVGPSLGYLVKSRMGGTSSYWDMEQNDYTWTEDGNAKSDFKAFEFRMFASIGLEIPIKNKFRISIDNAYSRGFTNAANNGLGNAAIFLSSKDITVTLGIIYTLDNFSYSNIFRRHSDKL